MPNPSLQLDNDAPEGTIYVRYQDIRGEWAEPFPIKFEPNAQLEKGHRQILEMTSSNWLSFREFNGLMVYWSHLISYRCAIREVKIGIDTTVPDKKLALPPCNPADPVLAPGKVGLLHEASGRDEVDVDRTDLQGRLGVGAPRPIAPILVPTGRAVSGLRPGLRTFYRFRQKDLCRTAEGR